MCYFLMKEVKVSKITHIILYSALIVSMFIQQGLIEGYVKMNDELIVTIDGLIAVCPGNKAPTEPTPDLDDRYYE